ncbi:MAG: hypothetical protein KF724_07680 [Phycisphaeraceae bacterium]|nr:hypothetical protein [Phycisphaeraceae bacterium]
MSHRVTIVTRVVLLLWVTCLGAGLMSCAGGDQLRSERASPVGGAAVEIAPGFEVLSSGPPTAEVRGGDLLPPIDDEVEWTILLAKGPGAGAPGETLTVRSELVNASAGAVKVHEGADQTLHLLGVGKSITTMPSTDAHRDEAVSRFSPPLLVASATVAPSGVVEGNADMVVEAMGKSGRERDRGTATRRLQFTADETIRTGLGELACKRVEIHFHAKLRFAEAEVRTTRWILPGVGPVAEEEHERIVVLGLIPRESSRVMTRTTPLP